MSCSPNNHTEQGSLLLIAGNTIHLVTRHHREGVCGSKVCLQVTIDTIGVCCRGKVCLQVDTDTPVGRVASSRGW